MDENHGASSSSGATVESEKLCENDGEPKNVSADKDNATVLCCDDVVVDDVKTEHRMQSLEEFKKELSLKRQGVMTELKAKINCLRQQLASEKEINERLRNEQRNHKCGCNGELIKQNTTTGTMTDEINAQKTTSGIVANDDDSNQSVSENEHDSHNDIALKSDLADVQLSLQLANAEILSLTSELSATRRQVASLKEVIMFSKQMVDIRENQLNQLKKKLKEIEDSLAERELKIMSDQLRLEYDRQLTNIRNLRALYEERARVSAAERENLLRQLDTKRTELEAEVEKSGDLETRLTAIEKELEENIAELSSVQEQFTACKSENKSIHAEMAVINQLFSQLIMGFNGGNDINIDKLTDMLEDNRDLLSDITKRETSLNGAAALPKLLFDLVSQSEDSENSVVDSAAGETIVDADFVTEETLISKSIPTAQNIVDNLPKVWKVLIELLNHQKAEKVTFNESGESEDCYNSIQTPTGPQLVLSVSKTYIKLKDLILEKKFLQKETNKLKNLNSHLESRLGQQEKRLGAVSIELNKTWSLVGRMQRQHRQLHTHEQVLRYQLQQKRRMLNELKDELEYCRRKWALAREKNNESQTQWNSLRLEFSNRKLMDANNSAESGYSDDPVSDEDNTDKEISIKNICDHSLCPSPTPGVSSEPNIPSTLKSAITEVYQTASTINEDLRLQNVATRQESCDNLAYASSSSVVASTVVEPVRVKKIRNKARIAKVKPSVTLPKLSRELRLHEAVTEKSVESLEQMFYRISGLEQPAAEVNEVESEESEEESDDSDDSNISDNDNDSVRTENNITVSATALAKATEAYEQYIAGPSHSKAPSQLELDDEERRVNRAARFKRLEDQCQELIHQVTKTSHRGDELNLQLDKVQRRYTPSRTVDIQQEQTLLKTSTNDINGANTSASGDSNTSLTPQEQEYTSRRAARLKRLEEECQEFLLKVSSSNSRATQMNDKLTNLHQRYGSSPDERKIEDPIADRMLTLDVERVSLMEIMDASNSRVTSVDEIDLNSYEVLTETDNDVHNMVDTASNIIQDQFENEIESTTPVNSDEIADEETDKHQI